jgi:hypothetical protein
MSGIEDEYDSVWWAKPWFSLGFPDFPPSPPSLMLYWIVLLVIILVISMFYMGIR